MQMSSTSACEQKSFPVDQKNKTTGTKRTRTIETITVAEETDKNEEKVDNSFDKKKRKSAKQRVPTNPTNLAPSTAENGTEEKGKQKRNQKQGQVEFDYEMRRVLPPQNLEVTVKNGVRYLQPYWGLFCGYSKRRWIGKTIAEVYATEFNNLLHPLYAQAACRKGRIFVNSRPIFSANHRIRDNEYFLHINHRHETEIPHLPIQILAETDDILVLNKPAGLPVHPCGNYALHSVLGLLRREYGREKDEVLTCLYRLDRTTTGLLMFAKNTEYDKQFKKLVRERKLVKEYVCKVEGRFPDGEIICDAPLGVLCPQMGLRCVRPDGQEALSSFSLLRYLPSENASVVSCTIVTGRTHQIRIHLQFLGHPIIGDRLYNDEGWGPEKGKAANYGERTREQLAHDIGTRHSKDNWIIERDEEYEQRIRQIGEDEECAVDEFDLKNLDACLKAMPAFDPLCWGCAIKKKREMQERDWLMALHCHRYSGDGWAYEAPLPDWATTEIEADSDPQQGEEEENAMNGDGTDNQQKQRRSSSTTTTPATTKTTAGEETVPKSVAPPTAMTEEEDEELVPKNAQNAL